MEKKCLIYICVFLLVKSVVWAQSTTTSYMYTFNDQYETVVEALNDSVLDASAQTVEPTNVPSPNAASLGRFGNITVSPFTGQVNVSVPLYTLSVRGLDMIIYMNANGM